MFPWIPAVISIWCDLVSEVSSNPGDGEASDTTCTKRIAHVAGECFHDRVSFTVKNKTTSFNQPSDFD